MSLGPIERLVVAQEMYRRLGEIVSTKDPDSLRGKVTESYRQLYEVTGGKSFDVRLGGVKVGTFSFDGRKASPAWDERVFRAEDDDALRSWVARLGREELVAFAQAHARDLARELFEETGEMPDGCRLATVSHPETADGIQGNGKLRLDDAKVDEALGRMGLGGAEIMEALGNGTRAFLAAPLEGAR